MKQSKRMIKYTLVFLLVAVMMAFSVGAKVYGGSQDGITWSLDLNSGDMSVSGSGEMPDYLNYSDTPWGSYITLAKNITIDGFTSIGSNAFVYAREAESITLPETVTKIGENAFAYCYSLTDINLTSGLETIGANAFESAKSLSEIVFPEALVSIGSYAFSACTSLESADLSNTAVTELCEGTFAGCASLETVVLPEGLTSIGEGAFYDCVTVDTETGNTVKGLTSINIPASVSVIGPKAFFNCLSLSGIDMKSRLSVSTDTFYNVPQTYTVSFKNPDGSTVLTYEARINTVAEYTGETPAVEASEQYHYTFKSWDRPFEAVLDDTVYTAVYTEVLRSYTVTWVVEGEIKDKRTFKYGETPEYWGSYPDSVPSKEGYDFAKWSPLVEPVFGDITYTAVFVKAGLGDLNADNAVNEADVTLLSQYILGKGRLDEEQLLRANLYTGDDVSETDVSQNINIKDLIFLAQYAAQNRAEEE